MSLQRTVLASANCPVGLLQKHTPRLTVTSVTPLSAHGGLGPMGLEHASVLRTGPLSWERLVDPPL